MAQNEFNFRFAHISSLPSISSAHRTSIPQNQQYQASNPSPTNISHRHEDQGYADANLHSIETPPNLDHHLEQSNNPCPHPSRHPNPTLSDRQPQTPLVYENTSPTQHPQTDLSTLSILAKSFLQTHLPHREYAFLQRDSKSIFTNYAVHGSKVRLGVNLDEFLKGGAGLKSACRKKMGGGVVVDQSGSQVKSYSKENVETRVEKLARGDLRRISVFDTEAKSVYGWMGDLEVNGSGAEEIDDDDQGFDEWMQMNFGTDWSGDISDEDGEESPENGDDDHVMTEGENAFQHDTEKGIAGPCEATLKGNHNTDDSVSQDVDMQENGCNGTQNRYDHCSEGSPKENEMEVDFETDRNTKTNTKTRTAKAQCQSNEEALAKRFRTNDLETTISYFEQLRSDRSTMKKEDYPASRLTKLATSGQMSASIVLETRDKPQHSSGILAIKTSNHHLQALPLSLKKRYDLDLPLSLKFSVPSNLFLPPNLFTHINNHLLITQIHNSLTLSINFSQHGPNPILAAGLTSLSSSQYNHIFAPASSHPSRLSPEQRSELKSVYDHFPKRWNGTEIAMLARWIRSDVVRISEYWEMLDRERREWWGLQAFLGARRLEIMRQAEEKEERARIQREKMIKKHLPLCLQTLNGSHG